MAYQRNFREKPTPGLGPATSGFISAEIITPHLPSSRTEGIEVSVVMPCLDEAETIGGCITDALSFFARTGVRGEVVVGDNGSLDGSQEIARSLGARVVAVKRKGYGVAIASAARAARGKYIIIGDSDGSYDFSSLDGFLERLRAGDDLVMGNRFQGGIDPGAMPWKNKWIGNPVLSSLGRFLFNCPARDFHCGLRGFPQEAFARLNLQTAGMEFSSEMLIQSTLRGHKISEIPIRLRKDGRNRASELRPWADGWRHLRFMLLYSPPWLFFYPGIAMMSVGLLVSLRLFLGPLRVGPLTFDVHSLLFSAFLALAGFQAVLFRLFCDAYRAGREWFMDDPGSGGILSPIRLELAFFVGLLLLLLGLGGFGHALWVWSDKSFGDLRPSELFRPIVLSLLAAAIGMQTIFASAFLGLLRLPIIRRVLGERS